MTNKIKMSRFGFAEDPRGLCVKMMYQGRQLLGKVRSVSYQEFGSAGFRVQVSHFNGEPWPIEPAPYAVDII